MVLFAVFFWGMLWGIAGAFIGIPILIAVVSLCARNPATRGIAMALSAGGASGQQPRR
jgi:predicted PurR-regulated permease PerM